MESCSWAVSRVNDAQVGPRGGRLEEEVLRLEIAVADAQVVAVGHGVQHAARQLRRLPLAVGLLVVVPANYVLKELPACT